MSHITAFTMLHAFGWVTSLDIPPGRGRHLQGGEHHHLSLHRVKAVKRLLRYVSSVKLVDLMDHLTPLTPASWASQGSLASRTRRTPQLGQLGKSGNHSVKIVKMRQQFGGFFLFKIINRSCRN